MLLFYDKFINDIVVVVFLEQCLPIFNRVSKQGAETSKSLTPDHPGPCLPVPGCVSVVGVNGDGFR